MILLFKIGAIVCCAIIAVQDVKERAVQWIWFPLLGLVLSLLYLQNTPLEHYLLFALTNALLVSLILVLLALYTKYIAKKTFMNVSFGLGDLLFFYAFALGFPTFTFVLLFVAAILFSFLVFLLKSPRKEGGTVPLAGLMGVFLIGVFLISCIPNMPSLYLL
ncbi:MAG: hypothetical protein AAGA86_10685 [Bacteroidota bacterium]